MQFNICEVLKAMVAQSKCYSLKKNEKINLESNVKILNA